MNESSKNIYVDHFGMAIRPGSKVTFATVVYGGKVTLRDGVVYSVTLGRTGIPYVGVTVTLPANSYRGPKTYRTTLRKFQNIIVLE